MAGVIARDRGPRDALALRRLDAARHLGRRELDRLADLAESRERLSGCTMRYIVAFNGLAGGLPLAGLRKTLADELTASHREANLDVLLELLQQELPAGIRRPVVQQRLATIQPDLLGEAVIVEAFGGEPSKEAEAPAAVRRAYALDPDTAAQALVRLVQDFAYAVEDKSATEAEKKTGEQVMTWLLILARNIEDPVELIPLVSALPTETTILREAAAELTERISAFFRQEAKRGNDPAAIANAARWVNALAVRLSALGRREEALSAAEEAVIHYRALAQARPDAFTPDLAMSLNNLAAMLSALGRREEALAAGEEAVRLRRALAEARPDAFTPDLAVSLNNLANRLSALGRREEALSAAEEAVSHYRALAEARPDAFTPDLATSLGALGYVYKQGNPELALSAWQEGIERLTPMLVAIPAAVHHLMSNLVNAYVTQSEALGKEPDEALLAPVLAVFERLQTKGGQS